MLTKTPDAFSRRGPGDAGAQLEVLHGICHAFGSASSLTEAASSAVSWIRAAVGCPDAHVRIYLLDGAGRFRLAHEEGRPTEGGARHTARHKQVLESKKPDVTRPSGAVGLGMAVLPLVSRGECLGTVEVLAPAESIGDRWDLLSTVVSQVAIVVRNVRKQSESELRTQALSRATELSRDLVRAHTPEQALTIAMRFSHQALRLPVAAWIRAEPQDQHLSLLGVLGLGPAERQEVKKALSVLLGWQGMTSPQQVEIKASFAQIARETDATAVEVPAGLVLIAGATAAIMPAIDAIAALLADVLEHMGTVWWARQRNERLDLGIALTAHEVRAPLLGAKAAIEVYLETATPSERRELVERSQEELGNLAELMEGLLRWSVGDSLPTRKLVDLVALAEGAVAACRLECSADRFVVTAPERVMIQADGEQLRLAILNILRNAASYSPPTSRVDVTVGQSNGMVTLSVRDRGKGIPLEERKTILDPFTRGHGENGRSGSGLGLFVARRIVEAHEGSIWLESGAEGATFHISLPNGGVATRYDKVNSADAPASAGA